MKIFLNGIIAAWIGCVCFDVGAINKCQAPDGKIAYSDTPCPEFAGKKVSASATPSQKTEPELDGEALRRKIMDDFHRENRAAAEKSRQEEKNRFEEKVRQAQIERENREAAAKVSAAPSNKSTEELLGLALNLNGLLCGEVTDIRTLKLPNMLEVECVEYRGGKAKKTYIFNRATGRAFAQ